MTGTTRRRFAAALGAAALAAPFLRARPAHAAEFTLKFGCVVNDHDPLVQHMMAASSEIKERSGGRVDLQVYHSALLGADLQMLQQMRSGAIDMMSISPLILAGGVPLSAISGVGFAFPTYADVWKAMDGALGQAVRDEIEKFNMKAFDRIWNGGYRQITTAAKPVRTAADLQSLKIRVPVSAMWTSLFRSLGASPASISWNEVYTALQTKVVDGQETPLISIDASKLYEVQKYCSITNHMWDGYWILCGQKTAKALPRDVMDLIQATVNAQGLKQRANVESLNAELKESLSKKGLTFNDADPASFRQTLQASGFYGEWKNKFGEKAWTILEQGIGRRLA